MKKLALLATVASIAIAPAAHADLTISANLFTVQAAAGAITVPIILAGIGTPSQTFITGIGYTISFSVPGNQGVVQNAASGVNAIPVADAAGQFLTGDFGSPLTPNPSASGNYLSTGGSGSAIVIEFDLPQSSFALLWGSIDGSNKIAFGNDDADVLTGGDIQLLLTSQGFTGNGSQGPGGSAYVAVTSDTPFSTVTLSSTVVSFEAAAFVGSDTPFVPVPEPMSLALLGAGLTGLGLIRRRV